MSSVTHFKYLAVYHCLNFIYQRQLDLTGPVPNPVKYSKNVSFRTICEDSQYRVVCSSKFLTGKEDSESMNNHTSVKPHFNSMLSLEVMEFSSNYCIHFTLKNCIVGSVMSYRQTNGTSFVFLYNLDTCK